MGFEEKINALLHFREKLDSEDQEVFDMLIENALEISAQVA